MRSIIPSETPIPDLHQILVGSVAPRPIAFVSTISNDGTPNLAPYSFFNVFSSNPPILVFSSNRKVKGNTTKDTLANCVANSEVVVNIVDEHIVHQMGLASIEYPSNINEFEKSGLTPIQSDLVKPFRVRESPCQMECRVQQILPLGEKGGAGNLIICEIIKIHIAEHVFDANGKIDPRLFKQVSRLGRAYYAKTTHDSVFTINQPVDVFGMGYEQLPKAILNSEILQAKHLSILAGFPSIPQINIESEELQSILNNKDEAALHKLVATLIDNKQAEAAWICIQRFYSL